MISTSALTVYEDDYILVLNKPAGLHSVSLPDQISPQTPSSCAELIALSHPNLLQIGEKPEDYGLINRLDHMTSGVLIAAKNESSYRNLRSAFRYRAVTKEYICLLDGILTDEQSIVGAIGARYRRSKKVTFFPDVSKAPARSQSVETRFIPLYTDRQRKLTITSAQTSTGARHQIRVCAAALGVPLLGDTLYGSDRELSSLAEDINCPNFFLHAFRYRFTEAPTEQKIVTADLPLWVIEESQSFFPREVLDLPYFAVS
jgi:23S rRNA pseudouridine1911/1915/1917 synthase